MFLRNCWYIAAWAQELEEGKPFRRRLLDVPVVLWRGTSGGLVAQEDRCPHRMAPLSFGRIEGDSIRCMYHGLRFDERGSCIDIPGQQVIPPNFKVRTYPIKEAAGIVWIWLGDETPDKDLPADVGTLFAPGWVGLRRYMHYAANYELVRDNLLDLSHVAFVHEGTLASSTAAAVIEPRIERFDWGLTTAHLHPDEPLPPYLEGVATFEGNVDRWYNSANYVESNLVTFEGGSAPAGTGAAEGHYDPRALRHRTLHALTPESEGSTHYFYSFRRSFAPDDQALTQLLGGRFDEAFLQDKVMIEAQAANIDPGRHMMVTQADATITYMRNLTRKRIREERARGEADARSLAATRA